MLAFWKRELLPALGSLPFPIELRFVGADDVPASLGPAAAGNVEVTAPGFVPDEEYREPNTARAAVFLSPIPYPIGVRTRIVSALAHGVPVVADPSAGGGLPEALPPGRRSSTSPRDLRSRWRSESLHETPADAERIGAAGRAAWERSYNPARNVPRLLALAGLRRRRARQWSL